MTDSSQPLTPRRRSSAVDAALAAAWAREEQRIATYILRTIDSMASQLLAGEPRARVAALYHAIGTALLTAAQAQPARERPAAAPTEPTADALTRGSP